MQNYSYLVSDGTITVTFADGTTKSISRTHAQAGEILDALREQQPAQVVIELFSRILAIKRYMQGNLTISEDGEVTYRGREFHHVVADEVVKFMRQGLPYEPLVKFLDRLMKNPSMRSVDSLYQFLVNQDITIDAEGFLVCYKAVRGDYVDKHSGTIDNTPGRLVQMDRNQIDDDPDSACSRGLHAGSIKYVRGFASGGDRIITVCIDPANVVSVPKDCDATKMRVSEYLVLDDVTDTVIPDIAPSAMYGRDPGNDMPNNDPCNGCDNDLDCEDCKDNPYRDNAPEADETVDVDGITVRLPAGMHLDINKEDGRTVITVTD